MVLGGEKETRPFFSIKVQNPQMPMPFLALTEVVMTEENPIIKFPKHSVLFEMDLRSSEVR